MHSSIALTLLHNPSLSSTSRPNQPSLRTRRPSPITCSAYRLTSKEAVLQHFHDRNALKIITGIRNLNKENVAAVISAADKGGATHVDIACDVDIVKLTSSLTSLPICVSSVDPSSFPAAVAAGASMIEIGNYDSFYDEGIVFSPEQVNLITFFFPLTRRYPQILNMAIESKKLLPLITLSVTVPHTLPLPDQVKFAELLEINGADIIQTEGGKSSSPNQSGVVGLIEKATPTLAAAYLISRAVKIPVLCSSGISSVTAPMAITSGASGVGVGSAVNRLNDVVAMVAEIKSIANSIGIPENNFQLV